MTNQPAGKKDDGTPAEANSPEAFFDRTFSYNFDVVKSK